MSKRLSEEKKIIQSQLKEENDEKWSLFYYNQKLREINKENENNLKREELDEKKKKINDFLYQKKLISDEARYISEQMALEKQKYSDMFDGMFSKKGLDKYAYMNIKDMISDDPRFKQICQYYEE